MKLRRVLAACALALGAIALAVQTPSDLLAQDAKAKKAKQKAKEEVRPPVADKDAKPAPSEVKPPAAPAHPMPTTELARTIDRHIDARLDSAQVRPSPLTTDAEFLRRASLDIAGVIPTPEQAAAFLDDRSPDKRAKLIDQLLAKPTYGRRMADLWTTLMYPIDSDNRFVSKAPLHGWLEEKFNDNLHWDRMAFELITATGDPEANGATVYAMSNRGVDKMTDSVGKLFLGVQIQCAQCHNHPFTHWKQTEYWGLAQFFYKVNVSNPRAAKDGGTISVSEDGRINRKINPVPESAKEVAPKLLGGDKLKLDSSKPYRPVLAAWVCSPTNPYFAKAFVNRLWAQYMGRGLVNPVDDLSVENEPSHPELLNALAKEFADSGFDVKQLIRGLCNSKVYQRSSKPDGDNREDRTLYSHMAIKVLTGEQLFDSLTAVIGPLAPRELPKGKGPKGGPVGPRDQFGLFFQGSDNAPPTAYEAGIPQALRLMNSPLMASARLTNVATKAAEVTKGTTPEKAIEKLYLTALARRPTADETKKMKEFVGKQQDAKAAYGDVLWVLLQTSEFALNR
jgi:hypothetical protein